MFLGVILVPRLEKILQIEQNLHVTRMKPSERRLFHVEGTVSWDRFQTFCHKVEYNRLGMNVELLAGCILLFQIGAILVSCKESRQSFCTLHESLYCASGAPSGIYWCANNNPTELQFSRCSELCSYWLTQNRCCLWLAVHRTALHGNERLAGSPDTK